MIGMNGLARGAALGVCAVFVAAGCQSNVNPTYQPVDTVDGCRAAIETQLSRPGHDPRHVDHQPALCVHLSKADYDEAYQAAIKDLIAGGK
jgi:hypothetical protein